MIGFPIEVPALSRRSADRSEDLRDPARLAAAWPGALVLEVDPDGGADIVEHFGGDGAVAAGSGPAPDGDGWGSATLGDTPVLLMRPAKIYGAAPPAGAVLLGRMRPPAAEADVWAVPVADRRGRPLRDVGALLGDTDAGLFTTATALLSWHRQGGFCPGCGLASSPTESGWTRICPRGHQEFPRTDPAVIMLVHDGAGQMVLARQSVWPPHRYSVLAGFVEAGEALEATVVREVAEEIGVQVDQVGYLGSQPWPFPRSLMIGFTARAQPDAPLVPRDGEIEQARWVDRDRIRALLAAGGDDGELALPPPISIARRMIEGWAAGTP